MKRISFPGTLQALAALCAVLAIAPARAATNYWDGSGTSWNVTSSWSTASDATTPDPLTVPGINEDVVFNITGVTGEQTLALNANQAAKSLMFVSTNKVTINGSSPGTTARTFVIGDGGLTVNTGMGQVQFGQSGNTVAMRLAESQTWVNNASATVTIRNHIKGWESALSPIMWTVNCASSGGITDSGALSDGSTAVTLVVASTGSGTMFIGGGSYSGGTKVKSGRFSSNSDVGTGMIELGDTTGSLNATLNFDSSSTPTNSIFVQAGSSNNTIQITDVSGTILTFGGPVVLNNDLTLNPGGTTMSFTNVISGARNLTKIGTTVVLSGPNTFTGKTRIAAGTLSVGSLNRVSGGTASSNLGAPVIVENGTIAIGSTSVAATLLYTGEGETTDRVIDLAGTTGGATIDHSGNGLLKFTDNLTATGAGTKTLTLQGSTAGTGEVAGIIVDNGGTYLTRVTKAGTNAWTLSGANSYSGVTAIQNGNLRVASLNKVTGGTASSNLGAPTTAANGTIALGSTTTTGQLTYLGPGETTDRVINLAGTTGGGTLDASGTGALVFVNPFTATGTGSKTLTLQGPSTATNTIAASIVNKDASNRTSLTKTGAGLWILAGTTTYSGPTTVTDGTLAINGRILSPVTVQDSGVLTGTGTIVTNNDTAVTVALGGILDPGRIGDVGTLSVTGHVAFAAGRFRVDTLGSSADRLKVTGSVTSSSGTVLVRANVTEPGATTSWLILSATGGITADFATDKFGYTVAKANADTELWLLKAPGGTTILFR